MQEQLVWAIGSVDGRSEDLVDNYREPASAEPVVWRVGHEASQRWPMFHPSEADPDGGYRLHRRAVHFALDHAPRGAYLLRVHHLAITPRVGHLEVTVNGVAGRMLLRPAPSSGDEILLQAGLHTALYAEGVDEALIPAALLRRGDNVIELVCRDGGEVVGVARPEAVKRLDRMASGAGFVYRRLALHVLPEAPPGPVRTLALRPTVLYRRDARGQLVERCTLDLELGRATGPVDLALHLWEGDREARHTLELPGAPFGHLRAHFDLFDGAGAVSYALRGEVGGERLEVLGTLRRRRKWTVYVAPHAHTDVGYTHRQWEAAERLCRNIDAALDAPPPATYHLDSAFALEAYLATRGEARRRALFDAIREGRVGVSALYVDLLTQFAALEDLIRNVAWTDTLLRAGGVGTDFAAVVDVASLSGALPAVLEGAGVRYLVHANNQDRGPFRLYSGLHRRSPYYWQGHAGGRVLVWLAKMYCELRKVCGSPALPAAAEQGLDLWLREYESAHPALDVALLYGQEADNTDLDPQPAAFVRRWNEAYAYPRLVPCDVAAFFREAERRFGAALPTVRGDGGAYWEDGVGSTMAASALAREAQAALPAAERLEALAVVHEPRLRFPREHFDEAWRQLLLWDEHTWGAFLSVREPDALLQRDQWAVKEGFCAQAVQWARRLLHAAATRHSLSFGTDGREVVVHNPHSFRASGTAVVEIEPDEVPIDPASGEPVALRTLVALPTQKTVEIWVEGLAGLSFRRFVLRRGGRDTEGAGGHCAPRHEPGPVTLENAHYLLVLDPRRGCVTRWRDKRLGRELVDGRDRWGFGQLVYARGGEGTRLVSNQADLPDGRFELSGEFELRDVVARRFDYGQSVVVTGAGPMGPVEIEWTLLDPVAEVHVAFRCTKDERRGKEAAYVAFPLDLPADAAVQSDSQLGWVDWQRDALPGGCREWLPLQSAVRVAARAATVLLCSPDVPLFCAGEVVQGRWPRARDVAGGRIFSYVLNNYWNTNYKASQGGELLFRYVLTSGGDLPPDACFRRAWLARRPLYGQRISFQDFRAARAPYDDDAEGVLARVAPEQVVLSTMAAARHAPGFVLRLQEIAGAGQRAELAFPGRPIAAAWQTDLLERELGPLPVEPDGSLRVAVPAWGLATVRIEF